MATLLKFSDPLGRTAASRSPDAPASLAGTLDPLSLATYRWRLVSGAYDSEAALDIMSVRLAFVLGESGPLADIERSDAGR